ncbi:hypothetical protein [Desulfotalea psychrophila]|uniref:Uncharacterized protein n=1 Tax=Desulfotalea psychrophila (strain LSv54 / DSM 12343) TaxID=177439 RepID=Q6ALM8_DESPS|nr:hypothetical protein [Desulfotalea psychrophila]CAG36747.1 unknown protein [Desulfotalea psychrophila LSv54]
MYIIELLLSLLLATLLLFIVGNQTVLSCLDKVNNFVVFIGECNITLFLKSFKHNIHNFYNKLEIISFFESIKPIVDVFAGLAAILGILIPLIAFLRSERDAIKIKLVKVTENFSSQKCSFSFTFANCKNYPVTLHEINIYNKRFYLVTESTAHSVNLSGPGFSISDRVYTNKLGNEIPASGNFSIILSNGNIFEHDDLYVHLHTSDGFQTIKCKNIEYLNTGELETFHNMYDIDDGLKARLIYFGLQVPCNYINTKARVAAKKYSFGKNETNE